MERNRLIGLVAVAVAVGLGVGIAVSSAPRWPAVVLGAVLAIAGSVGFGPLLIPWRIDQTGVHRGRRTVFVWPEVTGVEVRPFRTRRGLGPPRVDVVLRGAGRHAAISVYSRHDGGRLHDLLAEYLSPVAKDRALLRLITDAWSVMD